MKDILQYNNFIGSVHFSAEDGVFFGKLEGIGDLVTFEGTHVDELKTAFQEAVEDYLNICAEEGKTVPKPYKGNINLEIEPDLHRKAVHKSLMLGISLNKLIRMAIEKEVLHSN